MEDMVIFLAKREQGRKVKRWWFNLKAKQILKEMYPEKEADFIEVF